MLTYRSPVLWLVPLTVVGVADRLAAVVATQADGRDRRRLGRVDHRDPVRPRLRRRHRLRAAPHLRATATSCAPTPRATKPWRSPCAGPPRPCSPARRLSWSACSPCCCLWCRPRVGSVWPARSASSSRRSSCSSCCRVPCFCSVAGSSGRECPHEGEATIVETNSLWRRVGDRVAARPSAFIAGTLLLLVALSSGLCGIQTGLDQADQFLDEPEAISASERLAESFPSGTADPTQVLTRDEADAVLGTVLQAPGITSATVAQQGNGITQIAAVLDADPGSGAAEDTVLDLRDELATYDDTHVGGTEATTHRRTRGRPAGPAGDHAADPRTGAGRAGAAAPLDGRTVAAGRHRGGDLRRQPRRLVVGVHTPAGLRRARRRRAPAGVPVPRRAGRRLQHLPGHPRPRGGPAGTAPAKGCSARWPRPVA